MYEMKELDPFMAPETRGRSIVGAVGTVAIILLMAACSGGSPTAASTPTPTPTSAASSSAPSPTEPSTPSATSSPTPSDTPTTAPSRDPIPSTPTPGATDTPVTSLLIPESTTNYDFSPTTINGVDYAQSLRITSGNASVNVQIDAGRSHRRFTGSLGIPDNQSSSASYQVDISLDNAAPVYSTVVNFGEMKKIDLDITNALRIKITVLWKAGQAGVVAIGNPKLG
jgi:cytoskeletal protein RodZ